MYYSRVEYCIRSKVILCCRSLREAVSKVVVPVKPEFGQPGAWNHRHHRYLFVDLFAAEEADPAAKTTNGARAWDVMTSVLSAKDSGSRKLDEREAWGEELH